MSAMGLMIGVLCVMAIAYRFYSAFLAAKVATLSDLRTTPAHTHNDGQNYHPTNKWVLFGHHFAAISGAGPLLGPVLAAQFGYLPGLLWILIGVVLGGAVQDFLVLALSIRRNGRSLAQLAYEEIGKIGGTAATLGILFVLVIALAGLGKAVVKALGGEQIVYPAGTTFVGPRAIGILPMRQVDNATVYRVEAGSEIVYPAPAGGKPARIKVAQRFELMTRPANPSAAPVELDIRDPATGRATGDIRIAPEVKAYRDIAGSSWGSFTIFCTIPIALFVGWYMYRFRKGKVLEASLIGGVLTLVATYLGAYIPDSPLHDAFNLTGLQVTIAMAVYGFVASVLPVWVLLCPRDYLSSFLKIGTVVLLVVGVIVANPTLHAPAINHTFTDGGPVLGANRPIFPFLFITIMCGAISGFHALVASGTTSKMIKKETDARTIGYGAMLIEGLVGVLALIAASSLSMSNYYNINTAWADQPKYQDKFAALYGNDIDDLPAIEQQVGEQLHGRTGGAVTLAVGMMKIFDGALHNLTGHTPAAPATAPAALLTKPAEEHWLTRLGKYWYHFAIMFEALFILTTIDTGTRIGRFLLQETFGKIKPAWGKTDWIPGTILSTAMITAGWFYFINADSFSTIWSMFGIANQLLAVIALAVVSVALVRSGKARYLWVSAVPMAFVTVTTFTSAWYLLAERWGVLNDAKATAAAKSNATVSSVLILAIVTCAVVIMAKGMQRIVKGDRAATPGYPEETPAAALASSTS